MTTAETTGAAAPPAATPAGRRHEAEQGGGLTGTWTMVRFILRRDRVRLPVWIVGILLLVLSTAASIGDLYPTQADLDTAAATASDNGALLALQGPDYGLDTLGGQVVFNMGAFGYVVVALMGMFLVGRHTRADEETGRTELLRATVLGRNAPVTAVLLVAAGAFAVLGALIALSLMSQDLATEGSVVYGAAMGGFGLLFAGVTAVTAQITEHNRTALGTAGAVLGASYVIRAIGDIGDGTLSWFSPMGWAMGSRPFAGERPWTLLLLAGATLALVGVAYALLGIRDLGGSLVPPRPGPARASTALTQPLGLATRLQRGSLLGWAAALALTGVAYGSVGQDVGDLIGDNQAVEDIIAQAGGSLTDSYFNTSLLMMALITGGFAVSSVLRLRGEETSGHAEVLLATAVSRTRWAASHVTVAIAGSALIMLLAGLGMGITYAVIASDAGQIGRLTGAALAFVPPLWVVIGLTFALFGLVPRAVAAASGALGLFVVIGLFGQLFELPDWLIDVSPFQHVPKVPIEGFSLGSTAALVAVAAALLAVGFAGFRRRDAGYRALPGSVAEALAGLRKDERRWSRVRTPKPVPPLRVRASSSGESAGPAMSRWAQGMPSPTKSCRNTPAIDAPPQRLPEMFLMSATSESSSARISFGSGSGHTGSPSASAAACTWSRSPSWLPINPAIFVPSATMHAPVSVARSTMASGSSSVASASASASTNRPSASVFSTSTVVPLRMRNTSPTRVASPPGMLSVRGR